jgi:hypothetical protein
MLIKPSNGKRVRKFWWHMLTRGRQPTAPDDPDALASNQNVRQPTNYPIQPTISHNKVCWSMQYGH